MLTRNSSLWYDSAFAHISSDRSTSNPSAQPNKFLLFAASLAAVLFVASWISDTTGGIGIGLVGCLALLALYFRKHRTLHVFTFTFWVLTGTIAALFWPDLFREWNGFRLNSINLYLIQIIMFAMGASLSLRDFGNAVKMPKAVLIGMFLQFSIMPVLGWVVALAFGFEPEVAAGIILIGSCSGGVASNLMVFLARGNVALSVTMTACSTLMAPLMTPLLMQLLAGRLIEIDFWAMVLRSSTWSSSRSVVVWWPTRFSNIVAPRETFSKSWHRWPCSSERASRSLRESFSCSAEPPETRHSY